MFIAELYNYIAQAFLFFCSLRLEPTWLKFIERPVLVEMIELSLTKTPDIINSAALTVDDRV